MDLQYSHYARTGDPGSGSGATAQDNAYNGLDERVMVTTSDGVTSNARGLVYDLDHRLIGEYSPAPAEAGGASAADPIAETIWLQPEVANDNGMPLGQGMSGAAQNKIRCSFLLCGERPMTRVA